MKSQPRQLIAALFAGLLCLPALASETRQVQDALDHSVSVPVSPQRVVTLSEIDLDTALALGVKPVGTVNGRGQAAPPRYLDPALLQDIQVVGALDSPNLEALLELQPDLILTGPVKPEQLELLNQIAPTVITYQFGEPWKQGMQRSAHVLNRDAEASAFMQRYQQRVAEARQTLADQQGKTLSIVRWNPKGPSYMFRDAFSSSVIQDIGLQRPAHQQDPGVTHSMALSLESLELLNADWLVIGTLATSGEAVEAMQQARQTPAFNELPAIRDGHYGAVDGSLWTSLGGPLAALQVIEDVENLLE